MKLARMRVVEMRRELDARGMDSSGTRPTLMKRLREALNREETAQAAERPTKQPKESQRSKDVDDGIEKNETSNTQHSPLREPRVAGANEPMGIRQKSPQRPTVEQTTSPTEGMPSVNGNAKIGEGEPAVDGTSVANGRIEQSSGISMDERMQKRRERFGFVNEPTVTTDDVTERRRKRFGIVQKETPDKPAKRRRAGNDVGKQAQREHEEAKKRRAIKFGISPNTGKEPDSEKVVSADEMEKRLKRQRRFQQVGS